MIREILRFVLFVTIFLSAIFFSTVFKNESIWVLISATILLFIYNFLEKPNHSLGIIMAFAGGLFIDVYLSSYFLGLFALIFAFLAIIVKLLVNKYVKIF